MDVAQDVTRVFADLGTAVSATTTACKPLLGKVHDSDSSLDMSEGISLLLLRPQVLLSSLHQLIIMTALRVAGASADIDATESSALTAALSDRARAALSQETVSAELAGELAVNQEVFDKVRGLEAKLEYQIKKLVSLAEASEKMNTVEEVEEDLLAFRPNPSALLRAKEPRRVRADEGEESELYRPPRVAAVPYEPEKKKRSDRRAPALLSEFADTLGYAPIMESTSGLSTRPVQAGGHTNSISAKRAAELQRMDQFEEENMTRLVTNKREAKRRRDDEEALALGYGVGGPARSRGRRQNGLEAELEGVLGERRSKGVWDGVKGLGDRGSALDRGKGSASSAPAASRPKKARFDKEMAKRRAK